MTNERRERAQALAQACCNYLKGQQTRPVLDAFTRIIEAGLDASIPASRLAQRLAKRHILLPKGFGGWIYGNGWSAEQKRVALSFPPLVEFYLKHPTKGHELRGKNHPIVQALREALMATSPLPVSDLEPLQLGGIADLTVHEVTGRVHIDEYDGSESAIEENNLPEDFWL